MHKSAMLRYFETREQIFLALTAAGWQEWSATVRPALAGDARTVAAVLARTLSERPLFCDLLAQAPLNLERNVSFETVHAYKVAVLGEVGAIAGDLGRALG